MHSARKRKPFIFLRPPERLHQHRRRKQRQGVDQRPEVRDEDLKAEPGSVELPDDGPEGRSRTAGRSRAASNTSAASRTRATAVECVRLIVPGVVRVAGSGPRENDGERADEPPQGGAAVELIPPLPKPRDGHEPARRTAARPGSRTSHRYGYALDARIDSRPSAASGRRQAPMTNRFRTRKTARRNAVLTARRASAREIPSVGATVAAHRQARRAHAAARWNRVFTGPLTSARAAASTTADSCRAVSSRFGSLSTSACRPGNRPNLERAAHERAPAEVVVEGVVAAAKQPHVAAGRGAGRNWLWAR